MKHSQSATIYLKDYQPPVFNIETVHLNVDLYDDHALVRSELQLTRQYPGSLQLVGDELELVSIELDGESLPAEAYEVTPEQLTIYQSPDSFKLMVTTRIYPQNNTQLSGLYRSNHLFCTQCEAEGFRRITYFLDRPDVLATYTTRITAEKNQYPILLSNGNLVDSGDAGEGRHWAVWHDPFKKPSYLFALVAGDLSCVQDEFVTSSGRTVDLRIYVEPGNEDKCDHAMNSLKKSMRWDEEVYGREYDLDIFMIVAVSDFNMGAMENKGLNIFNSKYILARPDTATDQDFADVEGVVAHEYFHNWTGNRVTCRDWFQLSLKEGLTVFRDQEFSRDMNSRDVNRIMDVKVLRNSQFPEDASAMAHPVRPDSYEEINNFYTATIYNKGAEVIRMQHTLLGPVRYRQGMDLYFKRHDGQAVTIDDFVAAMEDANQVDLTQFKRWYSQA
ncbi:MAG: aminopeptidase N, partial [Legionella sp.]|nr:aminopeptidase N [Legionella sp.]